MRDVIQDLRFGLRVLLKNPGFTFVAVLTLALGIGANTAIFSLVDAVLLKRLPYPDAGRLVMVWEEAGFAGFPENTPAPANYADWKSQSSVFEAMAALDNRSFNLTSDGEPEKVEAYGVTADFFPLLGVAPALGRTFTPGDDTPEAARTVVVSHRLWQLRFGGDRNLIGREILLNDVKHTVIGVMPVGFQFLQARINVWTPVGFTAEELRQRGNHYLSVVARMKPGVTAEQANAEIKTIQARISRDYPDEAGRLGAFVKPLREQLAGDMRRPLLMLLVAVAFVLLIACANLANLLLSRAASRSREMAVRAALGAGRGRIVRQLLTESVLLAGAGSVLGLLFAGWTFEFLRQFIPPAMSADLKLDGRVLGFTLLVSLLIGLVFGIVPALQASKADLNEALRHGGSRAGFGSGNRWLRGGLIVAEMALALALLAGAGLMIRTLWNLRQQYGSLNPEKLLTVRTSLPEKKYEEHAKRVAFYDQVLARVEALPGVTAAGYSTSVPLAWKGGSTGITIEGSTPKPGEFNDALHRQISTGYLQTINAGLREGRFFDDRDRLQTEAVAIVNETLARVHWPGESALGKRFKFGPVTSKRPWVTVVGVTADLRQMGVSAPVKAEVYVPYRQADYHAWFAPRDLVVRTTGDPSSLAAGVREAVQSVDPHQPISAVMTMSELLGEETVTQRLGMGLLAAFAALALLLATIGIYGVLSFFVTEHTAEIGVRLALGAQPNRILAMVMKKGMRLALIGVATGLAASLALTRFVRSLLFEVSPSDPLTLSGVALLLVVVALAACYIPARRAMKVDPMIALRCE